MKLKGQVAVVTGAGRGIGRGHALHLARLGAELADMFGPVPQQVQMLLDLTDYFFNRSSRTKKYCFMTYCVCKRKKSEYACYMYTVSKCSS